MKPIIRILGIVLSLSAVFSCKKSHNDDPVADKQRISRVVEHSDSQPAQSSSVIDFIYDDQQRLDKIIRSIGDQSTGTLIVTPQDTIRYYYNGTSKNCYKETVIPPIVMGLGTQEVFYRYNNAGQVIFDSTTFTANASYSISDYTYAADKILVKESTFYTPGQGQSTDTFLIKDNNLAEIHYGSFYIANNTTRCDILTYDNKINPVNHLNYAAFKPLVGIAGFPSYLTPGISKNNMVAFSGGYLNDQGRFITEYTGTLTYTYTSAGLPETCIMKSQLGTSTINYYYQ